ncbi:protein NRT1/ PTR FAMILY 4.5-like [Cryptomeria japonica]|uniref:protein NRT1/ PTR FAMILY 4.5-like n=1 Tax=Cryptomeria japonica TaxID=3369 RepID=UPI0027DA047F|nr:protein NRT1/ PTR FAMILY 4.5-like [Cryptomeria japonica]
MEGFENMAFIANAVNLFTYFHGVMYYDLADSSTTLTNLMGASFLLALFGAFLSDAYINRFNTNIIFASIEVVGYLLLTMQAHFPSLRPSECDILNPVMNCKHVGGGNAALLYMGLYLIALGTGGVKAALPSLGANQFDEKDPRESRLMSSFFNWFFFSLSVGASLGVTFIVWIQNNKGWDWGFGLCTMAVALGIFSLLFGMSTYRNQVPRGSPLTRIMQVFVAAIRKRNLPLPEEATELYEVNDKETALDKELSHTQQFRFLDRAAIVQESSEKPESPWQLCTVTQVEEAKILVRMLPIFASTILVATCLAQLQTFSVQQGMTMDTHIGSSFHIPPASLAAIPLIILLVLTPLYDLVFVPFARRITGKETGITHLQRIGVGLLLSALSMAIAAMVEVKRKDVAREHNMLDSREPVPLSVFWLGFQYLVFGVADLFTVVGLMQFFYSQAPPGMKSLATAFSWCSLAFGYFLSTVVVNVVNKATSKITGSGGWLHGNNLNRNNLNLFYWMLAILSILNFFNYLYWSRWYKYKPITQHHQNIKSPLKSWYVGSP